MRVTKQSGETEPVAFDKITARISRLTYNLNLKYLDPVSIAQKVISGFVDGITTKALDELAAEVTASLTTKHPDHSILAARIAVSRLHKQTHQDKKFSSVIAKLHKAGIVADEVARFVEKNASELDGTIVHGRDYWFEYFGFKTLERSYLLRVDGKIVERPQHMFMRVAAGIHCGDLEATIESYHTFSEKLGTHASPTLFSAGTKGGQLASCFLMAVKEDSVRGIYETLTNAMMISKDAGGLGIHLHKIRANGAKVSKGGTAGGLMPKLRVYNNAFKDVDQGGRRPGAGAMYLEPWHADVFDLIDIRKNTGVETSRARDLFPALWIPDLFMQRVEQNAKWSLFSPDVAPGLEDVYGPSFDELYARYESEGRAHRVVDARKLWYAILDAQIETGTPFMLYKDACNAKSNQKNLGTIKSSNLCTEVILYTSPEETAVCSLASISLGTFAVRGGGEVSYDYDLLHKVTKIFTRNLNKVLDVTSYPIPEAALSNRRHRPIGLGVQGLADAFLRMRLPFESPGAAELNRNIFETIYHAALEASCELAERDGPYETFVGSPASQGILQFDLWGEEAKKRAKESKRYDWDALKARIVKGGLRNSVLISPMPTATTSHILGNNEAFEPFTTNVYVRRVLSGEFQMVNRYLMADLIRLGLWDDQMKDQIMAANGSIQGIDLIPADIKSLYKTVWEISQQTIIDLAADRAIFVDQSQSMNIHMSNPSHGKLTSMHYYGWRKGLKTGMYYLRTTAAADPQKVTVPMQPAELKLTCSMNSRDTDECVMCSA